MKVINNVTETVRDDLSETLRKGSRLSIAAACFSIYAYQELRKQLDSVEQVRFIFTSPTFVQEKTPKTKREFYIPRLSRERSLYGTEFEIKLRNELTQRAIAKECADWIRKKVTFKSNTTPDLMTGFLTVDESTYMPISGFTTVDFGCERGNNIYNIVTRTESFENGRQFIRLFDEIWQDERKLQDVTDIVLESITTAYRENSPDFIYFYTLYNIFNEFLEDISEDVLPNEATGFKQSKIWNMLYNFQRDAVLAIISKLEKYNGCILADSVGLGKTFTALAVIKYYEGRNKSVLVLCPKKLSANWSTYKGNYVNNPIAADRLRYDVLYHTDLSRERGTSNGLDLALLNWGNYDLVVIDESHNFRNGEGGEGVHKGKRENRYQTLMRKVIQAGVKTKVLIHAIEQYTSGECMLDLVEISDDSQFDDDDQNGGVFQIGKKVKIDLADMDYKSWLHQLSADRDNLELLSAMVADITPTHDTKLQTLLRTIDDKMAAPINEGNKKIIIFTAFSDTAEYLYEHVSRYVMDRYHLHTAEITGSVDGKTTIPRLHGDLNTVLTCFSPVSKGRDMLMPGSSDEIDILIATDCISEGQNLQDCDYLVNYDIHWNPVRIIQRFGRIDRIGSRNARIQLVNFWPDMDLDEYINLKDRVETRMKISVMTSTGDDNPIDMEEKGDLEYRRQQLKRLMDEVVDIEDMQSGISIMDLGLNEFRLDLLEYIKQHDDVEHAPHGMHAVVAATDDMPPGVIYVLRNINGDVNVGSQNRLHPFYMVYIGEDGEVVCDHLSPKDLLDRMRLICKGQSEPDKELCRTFNQETNDGREMGLYSELLSDAIDSIIHVKEESDIDSFLKGNQISFLSGKIKGLDDFELICFLVIK